MKKQLNKYKYIILNIDDLFFDVDRLDYDCFEYAAKFYKNFSETPLRALIYGNSGKSIEDKLGLIVYNYGERGNKENDLSVLISRFVTAYIHALKSAEDFKQFLLMQRELKMIKWVFATHVDEYLFKLIAEALEMPNVHEYIVVCGPNYEENIVQRLRLLENYNSSLYLGSSSKAADISKSLGIDHIGVVRYKESNNGLGNIKKNQSDCFGTLRLLRLHHRYHKLNPNILKAIDTCLPISESIVNNLDRLLLVMLASRQTLVALFEISGIIKHLPEQYKPYFTRIISSILRDIPLLQSAKKPLCRQADCENERYNISIISPFDGFSKSSHSVVMLGHLKALLINQHVEKITIIFTCESSSRIWCMPDEELVALSRKELSKISKADGMSSFSEVLSKLTIVHAPRPDQCYENLGDVVFRFEGISSRLSHQLYLKAIYSCKPVITITFSSHIRTGVFTDLILSRHKSLMPLEFSYTHPYGKSIVDDISLGTDKSINKIIITAYGGPRITTGLKKISNEAWAKLDAIFSRNSDIEWILVGSNDVDKAMGSVQKSFIKNHGNRISIVPFSDLDELYKKSKVFLTLPNTFGGGGGATMALARAIPLVATKDSCSDISNSLPNHLQTDNYEDALDLLNDLLVDDNAYVNFVQEQQAHLKSRTNLTVTSNDMYDCMKEAMIRYARRKVVLTDDSI